MQTIKNHPFLFSILIPIILAITYVLIFTIPDMLHHFQLNDLLYMLLIGVLLGVFVFYPFMLTLLNIIFLFLKTKCAQSFRYLTLVLGCFYSILYCSFFSLVPNSYSPQTFFNNALHTPIFTQSYTTILTITSLSILSYCLLSCLPIRKIPSLILICIFLILCLGIIEGVFWIIQVFPDLFLILLPLNYILFAIKLIIDKVHEWQASK